MMILSLGANNQATHNKSSFHTMCGTFIISLVFYFIDKIEKK